MPELENVKEGRFSLIKKDGGSFVKVDKGVVTSYFPGVSVPDVDFATFFKDVFARHEDKTALVDATTGERCTFGELRDAAYRVAVGLQRLGLCPADVVAFHCANGNDFLVILFGTFFAGGTATLTKMNLNEREAHYQFMDSQPKFVFCRLEDVAKMRKACEGVASVQALIVTNGSGENVLSLSELKKSPLSGFQAPLNIDSDQVLAVIYSSGTTGLPKGVQLTHRNIIAQVISFGCQDPSVFERGDVYLCSSSLMLVGGFCMSMLYLGNGCMIIPVDATDFDVIIPAIEKHRATSMLLYPTFALKLNHHPLLGKADISCLTKVIVAGNTITSSLLQSLTRKLQLKGVILGYGMTELTACITYSTPRPDNFKSVGSPVVFTEMKVVDVDTGKVLGPLEQGEIYVKGPSAFKGYLRRPQETADIYEDGFVRTGDKGFYSPDGCFFVSGRLKELIKCMDQQVAPAELEELLATDPAVRQVVVAGVPHPEFGEAARAFVVLENCHRPTGPNAEALEECLAARLRDLVVDKLSFHKHLHGGVEFVDSIPQTSSGKDMRRELKQSYIERYGQALK